MGIDNTTFFLKDAPIELILDYNAEFCKGALKVGKPKYETDSSLIDIVLSLSLSSIIKSLNGFLDNLPCEAYRSEIFKRAHKG